MSRLVCLLVLCALAGASLAAPTSESDVTIKDHPWQASFRVYGKHICGATILNDVWILTAAHCIVAVQAQGASASAVTIAVGTNNLYSGGQVLQARDMMYHPKYNHVKVQYDIGLVRLEQPILLGADAQPTVLPGSKAVPKTSLHATGFGSMKTNVAPSYGYLKEIEVTKDDASTCLLGYGFGTGFSLDNSVLCGNGKGACQGDCGGPVLNGDGVQVGVMSWGFNCDTAGFVYTDLADPVARSWVQKLIIAQE